MNALAASPFAESMSFDAGGAVLTNAGSAVSLGAPRAGRRGGGPPGMDAGAETGPYAVVTGAAGTSSRQMVAEQLFTVHYPKLAGWVRRLVDDDETAHEIASEAFTRLLSRWSRLDNPQSYLYMIATNLIRDHWRKTSRERRAMKTFTAAVPMEPAWHQVQDVDVRALIEGRPPRLRSAFLLHYYAGFGVKEVASMLGRPEGTVKADLHHARAKLKAAMGETP
jgi:RNA polymerase sigma-70 factor, ECF subfamily